MTSIERLAALPRTRLGFLPTPIVELPRLSSFLGGPRLWMKCDDQTGLGLGGNKIRKLEYLVGQARVQRCDTLVTSGAMQSNHCRQTAAAAAAVGMECVLALGGEEPESVATGNLLLDRLLGATIHWCGDSRKGEQVPGIMAELRSQGRTPYEIPYGGSDEIGAMGFVTAIAELKAQVAEKQASFSTIVVASSSGGTQAGMVVGADLFGIQAHILGIGIDQANVGAQPYEVRLAELANRIADRLGMPAQYTAERFDVRTDYLGGGYGVVGDLEREAIWRTARLEGILLDPVYTGRAMGGLMDRIRAGEFARSDAVLFWHTGGAPALFARADDLLP